MIAMLAQEETRRWNAGSASTPVKGTNMPSMPEGAPADYDVEYFNRSAEPTILQIADAEKYAGYSTEVVLLTVEEHAAVYSTPIPEQPAGHYRFGFGIGVFPAEEKFQIRLFSGAGPRDLFAAEEELQAIREGHFSRYPWHEHQSKKHPGTVYYRVALGIPTSNGREPDDVFVACTDAGCVESYHAVDADDLADPFIVHVADVIKSTDWEIRVERTQGAMERDPAQKRWHIVADYNSWSGDCFTPDEAVSFANDLRWAAATAAKLNGLQAVA